MPAVSEHFKRHMVIAATAGIGVQIGIRIQRFILEKWGQAGSDLYVSVSFVVVLVVVGSYILKDALHSSHSGKEDDESTPPLAQKLQAINLPPMLNAKSIAYSDSASGKYISNVLIPKLGLADALKDKARMIPAEPVGKVVARGEAEIGFQQLSELKPIEGIHIVGLIPEAVQEVTLFSAGMVKGAKNPEGAKALLKYLASPQSSKIIDDTGLEAANR